MKLEDDLAFIRSQMGDDMKENVRLIFELSDTFRDRPYASQLQKELTQLFDSMLDGLSTEEIDELDKYIQEISKTRFSQNITEVMKLLNDNKIDQALALIDELEKKGQEMIREDESRENAKNVSYRMTFTTMEYFLLTDYYLEKNTYLLPVDLVSLYTMKGQALFMQNRTEEAKECVRKALSYDPVSVEILFVLADMDSMAGNYNALLMDLDRVYRNIYQTKDFKKYYDYLATYFEKYLNDKSTATLIRNSICKKKGEFSEIIKSIPARTKARLTKRDVPLTCSSEVLSSIDKWKNSTEVGKEERRFLLDVEKRITVY